MQKKHSETERRYIKLLFANVNFRDAARAVAFYAEGLNFVRHNFKAESRVESVAHDIGAFFFARRFAYSQNRVSGAVLGMLQFGDCYGAFRNPKYGGYIRSFIA